MIKKYYDASSLDEALAVFERSHGMSSADFAARVEAGETFPGISGFQRHTWLSFYRDACRMRGGSFASHASRVLVTT